MTTNYSPLDFGVSNLLTKVVPGAIIASPLIIYTLISESPSIDLDSNLLILALVLFAFVMGEFVELIRAIWNPVPATFRQALYHETGRDEILGPFDRMELRVRDFSSSLIPDWISNYVNLAPVGTKTVFSNSDVDFIELYREHIGLDPYETKSYDLYFSLLTYLEPKFSSRTLRYQMLHKFSRNYTVATIFAILYSWIIALIDYSPEWGLTAIIISFFIWPLGFLIFTGSTTTYLYIDSMLIDYYIDQNASD